MLLLLMLVVLLCEGREVLELGWLELCWGPWLERAAEE
jgi:hypothetical protein